jgi:hypothetical protein
MDRTISNQNGAQITAAFASISQEVTWTRLFAPTCRRSILPVYKNGPNSQSHSNKSLAIICRHGPGLGRRSNVFRAVPTGHFVSEARKTAAGEISSGCSQPTLRGTVGARTSQAFLRCRMIWGLLPSLANALHQSRIVARQRRVHETRDQGVHGYVVLAELHCGGFPLLPRCQGLRGSQK